MTSLTMSRTQQCPTLPCRPLRPIWRGAWPQQLLSSVQRALVGVFVVGALALVSAVLMTASDAARPLTAPAVAVGAATVVELPRVVIHAKRLPPAQAGASASCPVPSDDAVSGCPVPLEPAVRTTAF